MKIKFKLYRKKPIIYNFYPLKDKIGLFFGKYPLLGEYIRNKDEINLYLSSLWKISMKNQKIFLTNFVHTLTHECLHKVINDIIGDKKRKVCVGDEIIINTLLK